MNLLLLLKDSTQWFAWLSLGLGLLTLISFLMNWGIRFRLIGATVFSILLCASTWTFTASYKPPLLTEGAEYAPVVFDNGYDLVIAQANEDFPEEAVKPTLEQIAGNLKGGGRSGAMVHIRIRKLKPAGDGVSTPVVLGEVVRDITNNVTLSLEEFENQSASPVFNKEETLSPIEDPLPSFDLKQKDSPSPIEDPLPSFDLKQESSLKQRDQSIANPSPLKNKWSFKSR